MPQRIRQGDIVVVVSGADKGKRGRVLRVLLDRDRVIVEGVNMVFRHLRKSQAHPKGGRIRREAAVHASNVMPIDPETNRPTRVRAEVRDGRRTRVGVRSGAILGAAPKKGAGKDAGRGGQGGGREI